MGRFLEEEMFTAGTVPVLDTITNYNLYYFIILKEYSQLIDILLSMW